MASFWKPKACGQTKLPDRSVLIGQKFLENVEIEKLKCDILVQLLFSLVREWYLSTSSGFRYNPNTCQDIPVKKGITFTLLVLDFILLDFEVQSYVTLCIIKVKLVPFTPRDWVSNLGSD